MTCVAFRGKFVSSRVLRVSFEKSALTVYNTYLCVTICGEKEPSYERRYTYYLGFNSFLELDSITGK
jgi:hypothetical protein